jgi:PAS domain S-box-containing protein
MSAKDLMEKALPENVNSVHIIGFIKNSPSGAHLYELNGNDLIFRGGNAAADRILGIDHTKLIGKTIETAFPNLAETEIPAIYKEIAEKGTLWESPEIPYQDDRISGYFKVNAFQTFPGNMIALFTDISNFKNIEFALKLKNEQLLAAEEELTENNQELVLLNELLQKQNDQLKKTLDLLHESEEKFKAAFKTIPDMVSISRLKDGNIYDINDSFTRITGFTPEDVLGKTSDDLKIWADTHERSRVWELLRSGGKISNLEHTFRCKDREIRHGLMSASSFRFQNDEFVISVTRDVEEIISARESLKKSEERFTQFAENIDDIFWISENNELLYVNNAIERKLGVSQEMFYSNSQAFKDMVHPDDVEIFNEFSNSAVLQSGGNIAGQFRILVPPLHDVRWIWMRLFAILDADQKLYRIAGIASDITSQKDTEQELRAVTEKAMESDQLKSAFLANLSHEIRTPMNGIVGFSGLLMNEEIDPAHKKQYIDIINNCSAQLLHIIDDMIDISKIEARQMVIIKDECSINHLLDELYLLFSQQIMQEHKSTIVLSAHKSLPDDESIVITDSYRLRQILMNLLSNAVKFTSKGKIRFGYTVEDKNYLRFFVEDTGIGIAESLLEEVFKPFRQADLHASREYGGTGLGLSICRGLVKLLEGEIWLTSKPGEGSGFYFTIPFNGQETIKKRPPVKKEKPESKKWMGQKILVVEDDDVNFIYINEILKGKGIKVFRASNGAEAIEYTEKQAPDIIIMDIRLPVLNGLDATKKIRALGSNIPIIAQTAFAMAEDRALCMAAGCNDYISKPIQKDALLEKISQYLNNKVTSMNDE